MRFDVGVRQHVCILSSCLVSGSVQTANTHALRKAQGSPPTRSARVRSGRFLLCQLLIFLFRAINLVAEIERLVVNYMRFAKLLANV